VLVNPGEVCIMLVTRHALLRALTAWHVAAAGRRRSLAGNLHYVKHRSQGRRRRVLRPGYHILSEEPPHRRYQCFYVYTLFSKLCQKMVHARGLLPRYRFSFESRESITFNMAFLFRGVSCWIRLKRFHRLKSRCAFSPFLPCVFPNRTFTLTPNSFANATIFAAGGRRVPIS